MVNCKHAASGCGYPEGECAGLCMVDTHLTIVYRITEPRQPRALLEQAEWSAASHTHAIHERDTLQAECDRLRTENDTLRETVLRWAARAEKAEDMLEAIGAGGVGSPVQPQRQQAIDWEAVVNEIRALPTRSAGYPPYQHSPDWVKQQAADIVQRQIGGAV